jgi:hypothetical protein
MYPEYYWQYKDLHYKSLQEVGFWGDTQIVYDTNRIWGGFFDPLSFYLPSVTNMLTSWKDAIGENSVFYFSAKIMRPAYGQRSTYQAEDVGTWSTKYPGYGYMGSETGDDYDDSVGIRVKGCIRGVDTAGYMVYSLYENGEQTDVISRKEYGTALYSDVKRIDDNYKWYVKPRMRIPQDTANNPDYADTIVAIIEVYSYGGADHPAKMIDTFKIKVKDFLNSCPNYDGRYIENFTNLDGENILSFSADSLAQGTDTSGYYSSPWDSKVDYRVKWLGKVSVWLDYVRLDDEWAHFLFTDPNDQLPLSINRWHFGQKIQQEVQALSNLSGFGYFAIDEFYYNHLPCIAEVNRLIKQYSSNTTSLICIANSGSAGLKKQPSIEAQLDTIDSLGLLNVYYGLTIIRLMTGFPCQLLYLYRMYQNTPVQRDIYLTIARHIMTH